MHLIKKWVRFLYLLYSLDTEVENTKEKNRIQFFAIDQR